MHNILYHKAVGLLIYAVIGTQPDIAYTIVILSRFSDNPSTVHWKAVKHMFCYLKSMNSYWLVYEQNKKGFVGYADADGNSNEDQHAISGYAFLIDGEAVSWSFKCQEIVMLSITESEYVAATHVVGERSGRGGERCRRLYRVPGRAITGQQGKEDRDPRLLYGRSVGGQDGRRASKSRWRRRLLSRGRSGHG